ncbi:hypothetical protein [Bacillus sp. FJAT-26390]|uniref:hypothetical protein n=1 Tax=Bacillus sp. FJAT-26390 TaxID=1743142 RepID=UPI000807BCB4|nr:hypothetical protein [Bacillus sp. FJAT-26390]OBZ16372.1 hypothetical protein A7975_00060 [Bacillus sp. FJAT-26390]
MKKILAVVLFICIIVSISVLRPNVVFACSCSNPSIEQKFEGASVIFTGTSVSKDKEGGNIFSVDKVWKGNLADGYVYSGFNGMCGTEFEVGKNYLVYTFNSLNPNGKTNMIIAFVFAIIILVTIWKVKLRLKNNVR